MSRQEDVEILMQVLSGVDGYNPLPIECIAHDMGKDASKGINTFRAMCVIASAINKFGRGVEYNEKGFFVNE